MKFIITLFSHKATLLFALFLTAGIASRAQLKVGANPSTMEKSSILELESTRQGLLLPRLSDTAAINALTPPDGMIIFLSADKSLRLRSNGTWKKIADLAAASANWSLTGNSGSDSALNFIGTVDGKPMAIKTNNATRLHIGSNGNIGIGTTTPSATLDVNGSIKFENLAAGSNELEVLVIQNDGSVVKRTMSSSAFENAIRAINGIQWKDVKITASASDTATVVGAQTRTSDSTIAIYLPVQNGSSASKPYGLMSYADWQRIHSGLQAVTIGAVAATSDAKAATIETTDSLRTIVLHPADATNPGIVTAGAQTLGGTKTFKDSIMVGGTGTPNSTLQLSGSLSLAIRTITASDNATATDNTILANTTSAPLTVTLPGVSGISGRVYTIKKIGTGDVDNPLTINPSGGAKIEGGTTYVIYNDWTYVTLQTDGSNWYIIKK